MTKRPYPPMPEKYKKRLRANRRLTAMPGKESHTSAGQMVRIIQSYYNGEQVWHQREDR